MNHLRQLCMALALTLTLSVAALAGQINCPGVTEPPPEETTTAGEVQNGVQSTDADAMTEAALTVLLVALSGV